MSRRDIADYLGLTLETVSRALSRLHELDIIGFIGSNSTPDRPLWTVGSSLASI